MKKIIALLGSLTIMTALLVGLPAATGTAPAEAVQSRGNCWIHNSWGKTWRVCITLYYTTNHPGITVRRIRLSCSPESNFNNSPKVDGKSLRIYNGNGVLKWSRGERTNIGNNCNRNFYPTIKMPGTNSVTGHYRFKARMKWRSDITTSVGRTIYR